MKEKIEDIVYNYKYPDNGINYDDAESVAERILSLFPSLDDLEVIEECKECFKGVVRLGEKTVGDCTTCLGTGKVTRAASWEDIKKFADQYLYCEDEYVFQGGGILRVKGE